ncbi:beta-carbonic anhydrase, cab [Cladophialophora carrionii]|uniref:Beta-carbonic anhydrase, cab n=1 Tax=Cladophialophora carrionii TaxID=86049 RepID=A0A1C1CNA4_9EURO|nr:beta-carbonic anhydrase, cab [Cladophialophora carrionii]
MSAARNKVQELLANNEKFASSFPGAPQMTQIQAMRGAPGAEILVILTCFDPRGVPEAFFGPDLQAAVFRNAGGRVSEDVIRSLNILRAVVSLELVAIVHHTGTVTACGVPVAKF